MRLAQLLWPDSDVDAARNALRQRLFNLRKVLGFEIVVGTATLALADGVSHDLKDADSVLGEAPPAASGEFAAWLAQQRQRRTSRTRDALVELAEMAERARDFADALSHAQELLALEPLSEAAHRRVMRLHYLDGDRAAALLAFDRCEQVLKDEIGAAPSHETLALLATLNAAQPATAALVSNTVPASVLRPPRLIGRDTELAALRAGWQAGQVAALIGEAGLGKTRLLQTFIEQHPGVVRAAGRPGDAGVPFATLARLLRAVTARGSAHDTARGTAPAQADEPLPAHTRSEIARVLPEFDVPSARQGGEGQRLVLQRALRSLLAAQAGLVGLVVDDLHFADAASLDMLRSLIDEDADSERADTQALHWALAYRPAEAGSPVRSLHDALVEEARLAPIVLQPLSLEALAALVDSLALPGVDGKALAPGLLRRTGGNPLFVLETLKQAWVERTLSRLADAAALPRPLSVGRLIERRIAQLSPGALLLARVASIAGVDFSVELAEAVLGVPALQLADALNELAAAHVLSDGAFAHDLVFEVVQGGVPAAVARNTHAKIAAFLETQTAEAARVAMHWLAAGRDAPALPWLGRAAQAALDAQRFKEFCGFLEHKARIEESLGQREAAFDSLYLMLQNFDYFDSTTSKLDLLCDRLEALAPSPRHSARVSMMRCNAPKYAHDSSVALAAGTRAWRTAQQIDDAPLVAESRLALGIVLGMHDRFEEALVHFEAGLAWLAQHGTAEALIEHHGNVAHIYDNLGRLADGMVHHERVLALLQRQPESLFGAAFSNLAVNRIDAGDFRSAREHLLHSLRIAAASESPHADMAFAWLMLALCDMQAGRFAQALLHLDAAEPVTRELNAERLPVVTARRARLWLALGQHARAQQVLQSLLGQPEVVLSAAFWARLLDERLRCELGQPPGDGLARAEALLPASGRLDLRLPLRIEQTAQAPAAMALQMLERVVDEALALGFRGHALAALLRAAERAATIDGDRALALARRALALAAQGVTSLLDPAERWLQPARAALAAGEVQLARQWAEEGAAWLRATAQQHVPPEFRDSFLHRNPVNRDLLALASRLQA
jgi:DNA-binding SARP family transcriptional activator